MRQSTPDDTAGGDEWTTADWASQPDDAEALDFDALFKMEERANDSDSALEALIASNEQDQLLGIRENEPTAQQSQSSSSGAELVQSTSRAAGAGAGVLSAAQLASFTAALGSDSFAARDAQLGLADSHQLVELDAKGEPFHER
jgi:hypothetical protein